jgi:CheY-like chemotaxis protein
MNDTIFVASASRRGVRASEKPFILLVEDHKPNVLVAGTLLENLGYCYEVASNGKEALKALESCHFAIVLMDIQMQEMDGLEATRSIRKQEKKNNLPRIPIIAMTAHAQADDRARCLKAGMDDYISKPFNPTELQEKLAYFTDVR